MSDVYHTVLRPDLEPAPDPAAALEVRMLGRHHGVPVWAEGRREASGWWRIERLLATDPELYLWPSLAPGSLLPP